MEKRAIKVSFLIDGQTHSRIITVATEKDAMDMVDRIHTAMADAICTVMNVKEVEGRIDGISLDLLEGGADEIKY